MSKVEEKAHEFWKFQCSFELCLFTGRIPGNKCSQAVKSTIYLSFCLSERHYPMHGSFSSISQYPIGINHNKVARECWESRKSFLKTRFSRATYSLRIAKEVVSHIDTVSKNKFDNYPFAKNIINIVNIYFYETVFLHHFHIFKLIPKEFIYN